MPPRAVLFDLDCTLTDRPATIGRFAERFVVFHRDALYERTTADRVADVVTAADGFGYAPRPAVCAAMAERLRWRTAPPDLLSYWRTTFPAATVARAGATEVLAALRAAGVRTAVVSNGAGDTQRRKLAAAGLDRAVDAIVISGEVGHRKPDAAIFHLALDRLGVTVDAAWFVGDHPELDVDGARRAGLTAVWMGDVQPWPTILLPPRHTMLTLPELMPLLWAAG